MLTMLSATELLHHSKRSNKALPLRGGDKDFAPDDGWLQAKQLEKFLEERNECLIEERVEKLGSIVQGEWNPEKCLVELHKEMGKFWSQMGFIDESRKWLHPEEAIFLMEGNTLEVWYKGLPVSIQQAYAAFLGGEITLEEYQVYAHLRRIGYVVIRHQGRLPFTRYERKLRLDQHVDIYKKKRTKHKLDKGTNDSSIFQCDRPCKVAKIENMAMENSNNQREVNSGNGESVVGNNHDGSSGVQNRELIKSDPSLISTLYTPSSTSISNTKEPLEQHDREKMNVSDDTEKLCGNSWGKYENCPCRINYKSSKGHSSWSYKEIDFPDLGTSKSVHLKRPLTCHLPDGVDMKSDLYSFDAEKCLNSKRIKQFGIQGDCELNFSHSEFLFKKQHTLMASNWTEYKEMILKGDFTTKVTSHYWEGAITPLISPEEACSTDAVLQKLSIVKNADEDNVTISTESAVNLPKISFDVYLPDAKFKKSQPGIPNHRVTVVRSTDDPPGLCTLVSLEKHYDDDVPTHWAVVDNGEVAFYKFESHCMPKLLV